MKLSTNGVTHTGHCPSVSRDDKLIRGFPPCAVFGSRSSGECAMRRDFHQAITFNLPQGFESLESIFFSDKDNDAYQPLADIFIEITGGSRFVSSRL